MPTKTPLWFGRTEEDADHPWLGPEAATPLPRDEPEPPPPTPRTRPHRRRFLAVLAVVVAAAAAGIGVAFLTFGNSKDAPPPERPVAALPAVAGGGVGASRVNAIYRAVNKSVVQIRTDEGSGTGFVIDSGGTIVTNAHVVGDSDQVEVQFDDNGTSVKGTVVGKDVSSDLAVVHVDPSSSPRLKPLGLANSDDVQVGDLAVAIGYPLGLARTATAGIVSGLGRQITAPNGFSIDKVIQTDAPINPGNSGGPLLDARGRVIGINSQIATAGSQGNVGIGFAVPSNTVRDIVPRLEAGQKIERAYLGAATSTGLGVTGAVVRSVVGGGPAAKAGLQPSTAADGAGGDVIVAIDGKPVTGPDDVVAAISALKPGDEVKIEVQRDGGRKTLTVELGTRPQSTGSTSTPSPNTPSPGSP